MSVRRLSCRGYARGRRCGSPRSRLIHVCGLEAATIYHLILWDVLGSDQIDTWMVLVQAVPPENQGYPRRECAMAPRRTT